MAEQWTIGRLLAWTTDYLKRQGAESPRLDAEILLAAVRNCQRIQLYTAFDEPADEATRERFRELVRRRAEHAGRLFGRAQGVLFHLVSHDARCADPTAGDRAAGGPIIGSGQATRAGRTSLTIADVGTGKRNYRGRHRSQPFGVAVTAIDLSPAALAVARENAAAHGVAERIEWFESDLFADVPADRRFDFVASNPPYVSSAEFAKLPATVKNLSRVSARGRAARHGSYRAADSRRRGATQSGRMAADGDQRDDRSARPRTAGTPNQRLSLHR